MINAFYFVTYTYITNLSIPNSKMVDDCNGGGGGDDNDDKTFVNQ